MNKKAEAFEAYLKEKDSGLYRKMRRGPFGALVHLTGKSGKAVVKGAYSVARKIFGFN